MMTTTKQNKTLEAISLSDYGLKPRMTVSEVLAAVEALKKRMNEDVYKPIAKKVVFNLDAMKPGKKFNYQKYFKGIEREMFIVLAFRYIIEHQDYEFNSDYSLIRRSITNYQPIKLIKK